MSNVASRALTVSCQGAMRLTGHEGPTPKKGSLTPSPMTTTARPPGFRLALMDSTVRSCCCSLRLVHRVTCRHLIGGFCKASVCNHSAVASTPFFAARLKRLYAPSSALDVHVCGQSRPCDRRGVTQAQEGCRACGAYLPGNWLGEENTCAWLHS